VQRALTRQTRTGPLASLQMTQERIADSWIEIESFRLLVLRTAWLIDKHDDYKRVRKDISAIKAAMPKVMYDVVQRSMHLHGSLGISNEMPFSHWMVSVESLALADGPTETHKVVVARQVLKEFQPYDGLFPRGHLPTRAVAARAKFAEFLDHEAAQL
jgi:acyl-CoA dehydrogenase